MLLSVLATVSTFKHIPGRVFQQAAKEDHCRSDKGWGVSHLYVELGLYHDQVERYFKVFGRDRVLVIFSDELEQNPLAELKKIFRFLQLSQEDVPSIDVSTHHNEFALPRNKLAGYLVRNLFLRRLGRKLVPRPVRKYLADRFLLKSIEKPQIDADSRMFLNNLYREDVKRLSRLLDTPDLCDRWGLAG